MADVFLSYAKEDRAQAKLVSNLLQIYGWSVFWMSTLRLERIGAERWRLSFRMAVPGDGPELYAQRVVVNYGHMDLFIGRTTKRSVPTP